MSFDLQAPPPVTQDITELNEWCWRLWSWLQNLRMNENLMASETKNWGSLADGAMLSEDVTVTGAALGDFAIASMSIDIADLNIEAQVTAADTVTVILTNNGGADPTNLDSGTLRVMVIKQQE